MKDDNSIEVGGEPTPAPLSPEGKEKRHAEYQAAYRLKTAVLQKVPREPIQKIRTMRSRSCLQPSRRRFLSSKRKHAPRRHGSLITSRQFRTPMTRISSSRSFSQRSNPITVG